MLKMGLSTAERRLYEAALCRSHTRRTRVEILTLNGGALDEVSAQLVDGQVTVDGDAEVTRSLSLTFLDPNHSLNFDTDSPDSGALYADRMLRVSYGVHVEALGRYVYAPVFTGPVTGLSRDGATVTVEAQGKEKLARGAIWTPINLRKGMDVTAAIRVLMSSRAGETRFSIPDFRNSNGKRPTLPAARALDRYADAWTTTVKLAKSISKQLFYNGDGVLVMRNLPDAVSWVFRPGDGGSIVGNLSVSYNLDDLVNTVAVKGQPPKGSKGVVSASVFAPADHPLSPKRLGRTGAPRHLVEYIEDQSIRSHKDAMALAEKTLANKLRETVDVTFDSLPIPHLDVGDMVRIETPDFALKFRMKKFTIPLAPNGDPVMSVGYLKRLTPNKRAIRLKGSKKR
jgi:hypothetical protein